MEVLKLSGEEILWLLLVRLDDSTLFSNLYHERKETGVKLWFEVAVPLWFSSNHVQIHEVHSKNERARTEALFIMKLRILTIYKSVWKPLKWYQPYVTELYIYLSDIGILVRKQDWFTEDKELSHPLHHWLAASEAKKMTDVLPSGLTVKCSQPCYWRWSMTHIMQTGEKGDRISPALANTVSSGDQIHFWSQVFRQWNS